MPCWSAVPELAAGNAGTVSETVRRRSAMDNLGIGSTIFAVKPGDGSAQRAGGILSESTRRLGKYCQ